MTPAPSEKPVQRRGPGSRADARHPTRHELLDAADRLSNEIELADITVAAITKRAGLAKGTFYVHFKNRDAVLVELHRRFHDELFASISEQTTDLPPGPERAGRRLLAFLNGCREQSGVRGMLLDARSEPSIMQEVELRNTEAATAIATDLMHAIRDGVDASSIARLIVAATVEVAAQEYRTNQVLDSLRRALLALVPGSGSPT
jgi:TetR/AcrR family transcriptional regulator, transcriptional repressor for nem operon